MPLFSIISSALRNPLIYARFLPPTLSSAVMYGLFLPFSMASYSLFLAFSSSSKAVCLFSSTSFSILLEALEVASFRRDWTACFSYKNNHSK
jgi:hypothetical protein